jgi:hypothetical protein
MDRPTTRAAMSLLLGAWLIGTIVVGFIAAENFWIIDRLLVTSLNPAFHKDVGLLPAGEARAMLRYLVSEQNRFYFVWWGWAEIILGLASLLMALRSKNGRMAAGFALMLAITVAMQIYLTPRIVEVGRALDFVPRDPAPPQLATFGMLHAAYSTLDLIKLFVGFWMAWCLLRPASSESEPRP